MLLNRLVERLRRLRLSLRLLAGRARMAGPRPPVILVPSILGTKLVDTGGRTLWGSFPRLFGGPPICSSAARPGGLLDGFSVIPGLLAYDVYGAMVRFLEEVGGYRRGRDLHVLTYDWRHGVGAAAEELARLVDRLRGIGDERFDVVGVSTGGMVMRSYLGQGGAGIRRAIYIGTPQRGSLSALVHLAEGLLLMPGGRRFPPAEMAGCQTVWDTLPHPDEHIFVDAAGAPLAFDLYDPMTWQKLALDAVASDLAQRLQRARRFHESNQRAGVAVESFVIGSQHLPTATRCLVEGGRALLPACEPTPTGDARARLLYEQGDDTVPAHSLCALPGFRADNFWPVRVRGHRLLPSAPEVHRLVLEALLATDRSIPRTPLDRSSGRRLPVLGEAASV
jgi:pimeloyl-ACP methyl ester carboxylesterase